MPPDAESVTEYETPVCPLARAGVTICSVGEGFGDGDVDGGTETRPAHPEMDNITKKTIIFTPAPNKGARF